MKLAIIGSRTCPPIDIGSYLKYIPDVIVSGGAKGADTYAREFAKKNGLKLIEYFPNYDKYGKGAPLERNKQIVDECDCVLAFNSRGSKITKFPAIYQNFIKKMHFLFVIQKKPLALHPVN